MVALWGQGEGAEPSPLSLPKLNFCPLLPYSCAVAQARSALAAPRIHFDAIIPSASLADTILIVGPLLTIDFDKLRAFASTGDVPLYRGYRTLNTARAQGLGGYPFDGFAVVRCHLCNIYQVCAKALACGQFCTSFGYSACADRQGTLALSALDYRARARRSGADLQ